MELTNITFDAVDPGRLAAFWAAATGRQLAESTPDVAVLTSATEPVRLLAASGKFESERLCSYNKQLPENLSRKGCAPIIREPRG
jgi:Glyoxalase-like domain